MNFAAAMLQACLVMQAPDGEVFHSYAKAQEHWEAQGEVPLRQPFSDAHKPHRRLAGLPPGWEVQATHRDVGKRQGQVPWRVSVLRLCCALDAAQVLLVIASKLFSIC